MNGSEYRRRLLNLVKQYQDLPWMLGDVLADMEDDLGEKSYGYMTRIGLSDSQVYDFARVARQFPIDQRVYKLPWSYYRDAGADLEVAHAILKMTEKMGWSREQMREARRRTIERLNDAKESVEHEHGDSEAQGS